MNNFIVFNDPAITKEMRDAGFAVFIQHYNGKECFAVEKTAELLAVLPNMKKRFDNEQFLHARTLHF